MRSPIPQILLLRIICVSSLFLSAIATPFRSSDPQDIAKTLYQSPETISHNNNSNDLVSKSALGERSLATRNIRSDHLPTRNPKSGFYHPHVGPEHFHRHNAVMHQIRHLHPSLTERSIILGLTVAGFELLWQQMDIVFATGIEYYRTTDYYQELIKLLPHGEWREGPTTQNIIITYGAFKLGLAAVGFGHELPVGFVEDFAKLMLTLLKTVIIVAYKIVAYTADWAIWITMQITQGNEQDLLGRSLPGAK
ncbi:MAG: hypothetical protein Q9191_005800 [Dirinaria sp. TL-2023a]